MVCENVWGQLRSDIDVLILLLMEHGLRDAPSSCRLYCQGSLNPSFNGTWSARGTMSLDTQLNVSLNPSFNGIWSARADSISLYQLIT